MSTARTGTLVLVEQIAARPQTPVAASGGIATGAGLAAALALGAQGVQIGTAFLATVEFVAHDYHKRRVVEAGVGGTPAFSHRYFRSTGPPMRRWGDRQVA